MASRYAPLVEAAVVLGVTFVLAIGLSLPTLWLLIPLIVLTVARRPYRAYGFTWQHAGGWRLHVAVIAAVLVPYVIGHYAWARWWLGQSFDFQLRSGLLGLALEQVLIVGLPEESFFRGYLQTQGDMVWKRPYRLLGARWGLGLPVAAFFFALCHVPHGGVERMITFFPGLFYGWLRARTGTVLVPVLYHAASNVLMRVMLDSLHA